MTNFLDCWIRVAADLFAQALAGEPSLEEALPRPFAQGVFGFSATVSGEEQGRFVVALDNAVLEAPLLGEGVDQKAGWGELLRETFDAAAGELLARTGRQCSIGQFEEAAAVGRVTRSFQLKAGERSWQIVVQDDVMAAKPADPLPDSSAPRPSAPAPSALSPGLELLLDVELEASLRFGCRELPLGEILDLGPGDVVQLDRHVADPVDLIVGDKIVARGDVVLVNGNFGLRITEVAEPRKRLESIRCLF
jgi:flagellar motor switch protein FliN/FliY